MTTDSPHQVLTDCPDAGALGAFFAGRLPPTELEGIAAHVGICSRCLTELEALDDGADPLVAELRRSIVTEPISEESYRRILGGLGVSADGTTTLDESGPGRPAGPTVPERLGDYQLIERLGEGGMGVVYRARHVRLCREVAVKVILPERMNFPRAAARFRREMRAVGALRHPNIVQALDAREEGGIALLVMEFLEGADLAALVRRVGPLPVADACELIRQAATGLQYADESGVVHRDIKPSNLMLTPVGCVKILDLGLARLDQRTKEGDATADTGLTSEDDRMGSVDYMAPEQWVGSHDVDIRADLYSLGCTLYYLLTGRPPFASPEYDTRGKKLLAHAKEPAPPVRGLRPDVPEPLAAVLDRLLAKSPADRYGRPADVAEALAPFAAGHGLARLLGPTPAECPPSASPVGDTPPDTTAQAPRPRRRRRHVVPAFAVAGAVALLIVQLIYRWFERDPSENRPPMELAASLRIPLYAVGNGPNDLRKLGELGSIITKAHIGDRFFIEATFDEPAYPCLVAINPDGSSQRLFPEPHGPAQQPLQRLTVPSDSGIYLTLDEAGLTGLVLLFASKPWPAEPEWDLIADRETWRRSRVEVPWSYNGHRWEPKAQERIGQARGGPDVLHAILRSLGPRRDLIAIRALVFQVRTKDRPKPAAGNTSPQAEPPWRFVLDDEAATRVLALQGQIKAEERAGRFAEALAPAREIVAIRVKGQGDDHWQTKYARRKVETLEQIAALLDKDRDDVATALKRNEAGEEAQKRNKFPEAERAYREALATQVRILGEEHLETANSRTNVASVLDDQNRSPEAEPLYRATLATYRRVLGEDHPETATAHNNLAYCLNAQNRLGAAETHYYEALRIYIHMLGPDEDLTALGYNNLANNRWCQGRPAEAEQLDRRALAIRRRILPPDHPSLANTLANLAMSLDAQGKYAEAEPLLREAAEIRHRVLGDRDIYTAISDSNLAVNLQHQQRSAEAEPLLRRVLEVRRDILTDRNPDTMASTINLAQNLDVQGKHAEAERLLRKALDILRGMPREGRLELALCLNNLATNVEQQGRAAEAESLYREAIAIRREMLGEGHPETVASYGHLVYILKVRGKLEEAEAAGKAAAASFETARRQIGSTGLERAVFASERSPLPHFAVILARRGKDHEAWERLEADLARGLLDDLSARRVRPLDDAERRREGELLYGLQRLDEEIGALPAANVRSKPDQAKAATLEDRRDALLLTLSDFEAGVAERRGPAAGTVFDLETIQAQLPPDATLVAWLDLPDPVVLDPGGEHWACLVRRRGEPIWVKLRGGGPNGAWTEEDDFLLAQARQSLSHRPDDRGRDWRRSLARLADQRLRPLVPHLGKGHDLPAARRLIILPSRAMAGLPVEALIAASTDLPAWAVSYAPSGTTFAMLRQRRRERGNQPTQSPRLLALGDPDFDSPAAVAGREGRPEGGAFARLPYSRPEVEAIARAFERPKVLLGPEATEVALDRLARGDRLREFDFLHLATHGRMDDRSALQSALILPPGRGRASSDDVATGPDAFDGRLTAEQIIRTWRLDADLVTLSACQTGLGRAGGGEGYVGFAQALFLAGARGVVLSLWSVDDAATALLMERFYRNLSSSPSRTGRAKADALEEAKRWLRGLDADQVARLVGNLPSGERVGKAAGPPRENLKAAHPYEHPYFWAAFILMGDPD